MDSSKSDQQNKRLPLADTGNASNPSPHNEKAEPVSGSQLLNKRAEKYLREAAHIEDEPDAQDQEDAGEIIEGNNSEK